MPVLTHGVCGKCRKPVLKGRVRDLQVTFDNGEFSLETVAEQDRYAYHRRHGLIQVGWLPTPPLRCLRRHHCPPGYHTTSGGRLFEEWCGLCSMACWRGELVSGRPILVNAAPADQAAELVSVRHDFPARYVLALPTGLSLPGADGFVPHWRLCVSLAEWRERIRDQVSVRVCPECGEPLAGPLNQAAHQRCRSVVSIYTAIKEPFDSPVWAGIPGGDAPTKRRAGQDNQCVRRTKNHQDQCQLPRDSDPDFTDHFAVFCKRHNPARWCHRATHAGAPCYEYTGDGSACSYHEGSPRMPLTASDYLVEQRA